MERNCFVPTRYREIRFLSIRGLQKIPKNLCHWRFYQHIHGKTFKLLPCILTFICFGIILQSALGISYGAFFIVSRTGNFVLPSRLFFFPYFCIGIVLTCTMTSTVLHILKVMSKRVEEISVNKKDATTSHCVVQWQRCYQMIHGLVHEMNHAFGLIMLIVVIFHFIWVTSTFFIIIQRFKTLGHFLTTTYLIIFAMTIITLLVTFMVSIPHRIKGEVNYTFIFLIRKILTLRPNYLRIHTYSGTPFGIPFTSIACCQQR